MKDESCLTCRWAAWQMTNHTPPRINPKYVGHCHYVVHARLPAATVDVVRKQINSGRQGLWAKTPYTECDTWEKKPDGNPK